jgi:hypothetical protein
MMQIIHDFNKNSFLTAIKMRCVITEMYPSIPENMSMNYTVLSTTVWEL